MISLDIEATLISWLARRLDIAVFADVPDQKTKPERFLTIERTGGNKSDIIIDHAEVAVQCWALTRAKALELAYFVDSVICEMTLIDRVISARRASLYNFPDLEGRHARYQVIINLNTT
jgi:hypothetical protein